MTTHNFGEKVAFIWGVADLIRDTFKRGKYQDVILPFTVLRRIDCVLEPTKQQVLEANVRWGDKLANPYQQLCRASGYAFYNTSKYDFEHLLKDAPNLADNLRNYISGFSPNMREVLEKFDIGNTIAKLDDAGLLFKVMERFKAVDLHPDKVPNYVMGSIFEELIRKFNEALDENPGEHFTPREVVRLMVALLLAHDEDELSRPRVARTVYDPCCGTGGMLTIAKDSILELSPKADVYLFGQEVNPETFAVCKADLYLSSADGHDADNIAFGSVLSDDRHAGRRFDYQLANPPYGKDWKRDQDAVEAEAARASGRFSAGLPRINDGQLLFLQTMIAHMNRPEHGEGHGRIAVVMNGSPLFSGDAGQGESEIRRWIIEQDLLDAIVALPEQLFYNTGITTYIALLSNRKEPQRRGKVQLIDARELWSPMRKSLGEKRRQISDEQIEQIRQLYLDFDTNDRSKVFDGADFGYRKITVERSLRVNLQAYPERIARLREHRVFRDLASSKKKDQGQRAQDELAGHQRQDAVLTMLATLPDTLYTDRAGFEQALDAALAANGLKVAAPLRAAILTALAERDENAAICRDRNGAPEADPELRDYENVALTEDVAVYFAREVAPYVPDAWINTNARDERDGEVGRVGYEINFNRYFYRYQPPRPLEEIERDIRVVEAEILEMLREALV